jgi:hypothetical protein
MRITFLILCILILSSCSPTIPRDAEVISPIGGAMTNYVVLDSSEQNQIDPNTRLTPPMIRGHYNRIINEAVERGARAGCTSTMVVVSYEVTVEGEVKDPKIEIGGLRACNNVSLRTVRNFDVVVPARVNNEAISLKMESIFMFGPLTPAFMEEISKQLQERRNEN